MKFFQIFPILTLAVGLSTSLYGQDERFFKELFFDELNMTKDTSSSSKGIYDKIVHSDAIRFDLDRDGKLESIVFLKKDAEDWVDIFNHQRKKIFSFRFAAKGIASKIHKVEIKTLGKDTVAVLFYYYEGMVKYLDFNASGRLYILTIDHQNLKSISMFKSQSFYEESRGQKVPYHERSYDVTVLDLNGDSIKEVMIKQRHVSSVFWYKGNGKWATY